ncbi:MAG: PAS domain-containing sensor histidine kinase, partial [Leptospira sp.]|nr:PAS domain-containing sensor histidine kinase [Leptospira sp.]
MNIDPRTILIVNLFGCLIMSLGLWTASMAFFKRAKFVKEWAIATLIQAVGWAVTGALRGIIPDGISIICGNGLIFGSLLFYYTIIRKFFDKTTPWIYFLVTILLYISSLYAVYNSGWEQKFRVVVISLYSGTVLVLSAYEIFYASKDHKISSRFTGYFFGVCGVFLLIRVFIYSFANIPKEQVSFGPGPIQDVTYLFFFATSAMLTFGFLHMIADRFASDLLISENNLHSALKEVQNLNQTKDKFMS